MILAITFLAVLVVLYLIPKPKRKGIAVMAQVREWEKFKKVFK